MKVNLQFEWDENKRQKNLEKHGLDFYDAKYLFENDYIQNEVIENGEKRTVVFGILKDQMCVLEVVFVYTKRGSNYRAISFRKASKRERKKYYEHINV